MVKKPQQPHKPEATAAELMRPSPTADYEPRGYNSNFSTAGFGRPPFAHGVITQMLMDPRVIYGLWLIKGPILSNAHVKVECENEDLKQFIINQINRFWMNSAVRSLKAIEWGLSGSEIIYREKDGLIQFDEARDFHSPDLEVVVDRGVSTGIVVKNVQGKGKVYLGFPKSLLHVHWRERNRWYGLSRLYGAHIPWWETWGDGGYRDIRRLWYYKNSFNGGIMRHPAGVSQTETPGVVKSNRDIAREIVEKQRAGGVMCLPNTTSGDKGEYAWTYEPPAANASPEGLLEYGETLRDEILEALGIPPEVVSSGGDQGFGSSTGRQVPQLAFYSTLQELLQWLVHDYDQCVLRPLVEVNAREMGAFGGDDPTNLDYDILPFKLSEDVGSGEEGDEGGGMGSELQPDNFNGNQFQDETQNGFGKPPAQSGGTNRFAQNGSAPTPPRIAAK